MNLIKQFFYFTKSKLIVFISVSFFIYYFLIQQDMVLGNMTWSILIGTIAVIYMLINILWFSFKSMNHFLIGLFVFILLIGILYFLGNYSAQKRMTANEECLVETNSQSFNTEVMNCMSKKGYKKYR